jgi:predicted DNA-binding ribbon-helix-helix protein
MRGTTRRTLIRNVTLAGQRTSIRLDAVYWDALADIARRSGRSVRTVIEEIDRERGSYSRAEAIRVSILQFYRSAWS